MAEAPIHFWRKDALRTAARLEFLARNVVEGFLSGRHRSRYRGASLEFAQHREYVPGDDLRHLDWKVWARADRLTVKQYEAETNLTGWLLVDCSGSMDYGAEGLHKFDRARQLAATLAYVLLRQSDAVGVACFDQDIRREAPARSSKGHLQAVLHTLALAEPAGESDLGAALRKFAERPLPRGVVAVASDFLGDVDAIVHGLDGLRRRGHDVLALQVLHPDELEFPFAGLTKFEDCEGGPDETCEPRALRHEYLAALEAHQVALRRGCAACGVEHRLVRTSDPLDATLAALLRGRARR